MFNGQVETDLYYGQTRDAEQEFKFQKQSLNKIKAVRKNGLNVLCFNYLFFVSFLIELVSPIVTLTTVALGIICALMAITSF
jgi:hypothetical protein